MPSVVRKTMAPAVGGTAEEFARKRWNYSLTWSYPVPLPASGLSFNVYTSVDLQSWTLLLKTNQPPVPIGTTQPKGYFRVVATNDPPVGHLVLSWNPPDASGPFSYIMAQGTNAGNYSRTNWGIVDTSFTATVLGQTNSFCVQAMDSRGFLSVCSNEADWILPPIVPVNVQVNRN